MPCYATQCQIVSFFADLSATVVLSLPSVQYMGSEALCFRVVRPSVRASVGARPGKLLGGARIPPPEERALLVGRLPGPFLKYSEYPRVAR